MKKKLQYIKAFASLCLTLQTAKQGIPQYGKVYIIYLLLAFSVTTFIMIIIILIILLIKSHSHQTAKGMEGTPLEKRPPEIPELIPVEKLFCLSEASWEGYKQ
ncbi:uncharacterized protein LOC120297795 isoform X9 [Crotalus tigris]|uniref:uncharacterized protein LOC120297795 isoform X9 n=1 Tax=Crotalus tigris TaxID=88082 RepID=UPI00192F95F1|nr:uncharacterized protein LOC120297795 isoform X9 [Crotalus tigris]